MRAPEATSIDWQRLLSVIACAGGAFLWGLGLAGATFEGEEELAFFRVGQFLAGFVVVALVSWIRDPDTEDRRVLIRAVVLVSLTGFLGVMAGLGLREFLQTSGRPLEVAAFVASLALLALASILWLRSLRSRLAALALIALLTAALCALVAVDLIADGMSGRLTLGLGVGSISFVVIAIGLVWIRRGLRAMA